MIKPIRLSAAEKGLLLLDVHIGVVSGEGGWGVGRGVYARV